jgi:aconitate hydratase
LPAVFVNPSDYQNINLNDIVIVKNLKDVINKHNFTATVETKNKTFDISLHHDLSDRQLEILIDGGMINWIKKKH